MTFLEAAIEVLRVTEEALHFSEVAKRAVEGNLLSHIGRDPEAAMRSCLNSAVRAGRGGTDPVLMRAKPGYYQIRPGAELPPSPEKPPADDDEKSSDSDPERQEVKAKREPKTPRKRRTRTARGEAPAPASGSKARSNSAP